MIWQNYKDLQSTQPSRHVSICVRFTICLMDIPSSSSWDIEGLTRMGTMWSHACLEIPTNIPLIYISRSGHQSDWKLSRPMTRPYECQLINSPVRNLSLWTLHKAISSIRNISTSVFTNETAVCLGVESDMESITCRKIHNYMYILHWLFALMYYSIATYISICM